MGDRDLYAITVEWLRANGYDGLYWDSECGCENSDLMPCGEPHPGCEPGYKTKCIPNECKADGDCPFHISSTKNDPPGGDDE